MTCAHCCFNAKRRGHDMSPATFKKFVALLRVMHGYTIITVGGGEPTMHKHCTDFVWYLIKETYPERRELGAPSVSMITNGSRKSVVLNLISMAEDNLILLSLSFDQYHDRRLVDETVIDRFRTSRSDAVSVRGYIHGVSPIGRAAENQLPVNPYSLDRCTCPGIFINPLGNLYMCGYQEVCFGNLHTHSPESLYDIMRDFEDDEGNIICSKEL